jgi:biopolymer transport protein ExbB
MRHPYLNQLTESEQKRILPDKTFAPLLFMAFLCLLTVAVPLYAAKNSKAAEEQEFLSVKLRELAAWNDSLTSARWQNKYEETEYRKESQELLRNLDQDYNRTLIEKNVLEEKVLRLQQEMEEETTMLDQERERYQALRNLALQKLEEHKDDPLSSFPVGLNERIARQNRLQAELESGDIASSVRSLFAYRMDEIREGDQQTITSVSVLDDSGATYSAWQLRLGLVHVSDLGKDNNRTRFMLQTGLLKGKVFVWLEQHEKTIQDGIRKTISQVRTENPAGPLFIPVDVLQSRALAKGYSADSNTYIYQQAWNFLKQGGPVMIPLGLIAFLGLLMIIERLFFLRKKQASAKGFIKTLAPLAQTGSIESLQTACTGSNTSLGRVLGAILDKAQRKEPRTNAENALQEAVLQELPSLEKRLSTISVFGSTAPLLGLLGTVAGMISLFEVITSYGTSDPKLLAGGISEALITTEVGLVIAIPIILMHNLLSNKLDRISSEINQWGLALLNRFWPAEK